MWVGAVTSYEDDDIIDKDDKDNDKNYIGDVADNNENAKEVPGWVKEDNPSITNALIRMVY